MTTAGKSNGIGALNEMSLHAALKSWYAHPGDLLEIPVDGYVIDILRGDLLIEIQTRNFSAIKRKLLRLVENHPVRLVFPIAQTRWIVKLEGDGVSVQSRRKSPARGRVEHIFKELVRIPELIEHPNFSLEALLTLEEEHRIHDGSGSWRRKGWSIVDRRLLEVTGSTVFTESTDFLSLIPPGLEQPFTTHDLAKALHCQRYLAQKMAYCLRKMGVFQPSGQRRNSILYTLESK